MPRTYPLPSPARLRFLILPLCPFSLFPLHINRVCLYANATNPLLDNLTIRYTIGRRSFPLARFGEGRKLATKSNEESLEFLRDSEIPR